MGADQADYRKWLEILVLLVQVVSLFSCRWLLRVLHKQILPVSGNRLFPRMLRSLVISVTLCMVIGMPIPIFDILGFPGSWNNEIRSFTCAWMYNLFRTVRVAVLLQEAHMGLVFLAEALRIVRVLSVLNYGIPAVWVLAVCLGFCDAVYFRWEYITYLDGCFQEDHDILQLVVSCSGMSISLCAFLGTLLRSRCAVEPDGVQRRNFLRAAGYPLVSLVTLPLMFAVYASKYGLLMIDPPWFLPVAMIGESCSGTLFALTFWHQSNSVARYQRSDIASRVHTLEPGLAKTQAKNFASFNVAFGGVDISDVTMYKNGKGDSWALWATPSAPPGAVPALPPIVAYSYHTEENVRYQDCAEAPGSSYTEVS